MRTFQIKHALIAFERRPAPLQAALEGSRSLPTPGSAASGSRGPRPSGLRPPVLRRRLRLLLLGLVADRRVAPRVLVGLADLPGGGQARKRIPDRAG